MISRALITGFEPFGGDATNPSGKLAAALDGSVVSGLKIVGRVMPVEYDRSAELIFRWLEEVRPVVVICTGLAASAERIRVEQIAVNEDDCSSPDNANVVRTKRRIAKGAPRELRCTLAVEKILSDCAARRIPAEASSDAGRYVCNHVFFSLMHALRKQRSVIPAGFVHLPPAMPMRVMADFIAVAVRRSPQFYPRDLA